jgi:hypothetical protein
MQNIYTSFMQALMGNFRCLDAKKLVDEQYRLGQTENIFTIFSQAIMLKPNRGLFKDFGS